MVEGWDIDNYFVLFDAPESDLASAAYCIERWLPGYKVIGLKGWDDLLVKDGGNGVYTVPTVPLAHEHLASCPSVPRGDVLSRDARFNNKLKWYVKPLVFGGSPTDAGNLTWVTHEQHAQLVVWWNERYSQIKSAAAGA